ncbi:hypothetical protein R83H12_01518 [Fibrobacteria bacterium R8-3-H12]
MDIQKLNAVYNNGKGSEVNMRSQANKSAFTLIELIVYMGLLGFIIVVAGRVFSDSTAMRVRSQNMIASAEQIGKLSSLINEDVSQMGVKVWGENGTENYNVSVERNVYMDPDNATNPDYSSYRLTHRENVKDSLDRFVFRKASFGNDGAYLGVREITWYIDGDNIYRSCYTIAGTDTEGGNCPTATPKTVLMGTGIEKFYFIPSTPGMSASLPDEGILFGANYNSGFSLRERTEGNNVRSIGGGSGDLVTLSGFAGNSEDGAAFNQVYLGEKNAEGWKNCSQFDLQKGETYAVEFKMPLFVGSNQKADSLSSQFLSGRDHISVGLRNIDGDPVGPMDVLLYPSQSENLSERVNSMPRRAEFSMESNATACVALTFAFYSPNAKNGKLQFKEFRVFRVNTKAFSFPKEIENYENYGAENFANAIERVWQKENAKAFQLILETNKGRKGERARTSSSEGNGMIILTPNNGVKAQGSAH